MDVQPGDRVGILALNSDRYQEYFHAVACSLVESDTRVLFVDDPFAAMIPGPREQFPDLETVIHCGGGKTGEMRCVCWSQRDVCKARPRLVAADIGQPYR